jgi:hypothetical protein
MPPHGCLGIRAILGMLLCLGCPTPRRPLGSRGLECATSGFDILLGTLQSPGGPRIRRFLPPRFLRGSVRGGGNNAIMEGGEIGNPSAQNKKQLGVHVSKPDQSKLVKQTQIALPARSRVGTTPTHRNVIALNIWTIIFRGGAAGTHRNEGVLFPELLLEKREGVTYQSEGLGERERRKPPQANKKNCSVQTALAIRLQHMQLFLPERLKRIGLSENQEGSGFSF